MIQYDDYSIESVCPVCLKKILGTKYQNGNKLYIKKTCPQHGVYDVLISTNADHYLQMENVFNVKRKKANSIFKSKNLGCPYDCGLCSSHTQDTCLAIIEITNRCNLKCQNCFANASSSLSSDVNIDQIESMFRTVLKYQNKPTCVQISGGEPTLRDDLPDIIKLGKTLGIDHIELNTNGIRLSEDIEFFKNVVESGLDAIYLSFDGVSDSVYLSRCNKKLFDIKKKVIDYCKIFKIGVVLVPLISKDYNLNSVGSILEFAKKNVPTVRGVHFQPIFSSGRSNINSSNYVTIYDLVEQIELQTNKELLIENFTPSLMPTAYCGLTCLVFVDKGKFIPLTNISSSNTNNSTDVASRTKKSVINRWKNNKEINNFEIPVVNSCCSTKIKAESSVLSSPNNGSWIDFVNLNENSYLTISIMAFQDSFTYEIDRVKNCCIHVVTVDGRLIPFCNYNLSSSENKYLYRHVSN